MSTLIVIRIIPQQPTKPGDFTKYLNPSGLGALQIAVDDLSFNNPIDGPKLGMATYIVPSTPPKPLAAVKVPPGPAPSFSSPKYSPNPKSGIIQHYDLQPPLPPDTAFYQLDSVATAVIEVPTGTTVENVRIVAQWGSGAGATPVPGNMDFYNIVTTAGPAPDLNAWTPNPTPPGPNPLPQDNPWAELTPSIYLHLPAPPTAANPFSFQLPSDGTPPPFDDLMNAVQQMLKTDPGGAAKPKTSAAAAAGDTVLQFSVPLAKVSVGMSVSAATGIPDGTTAVAIDLGTGKVTLSQELSGAIGSGVTITFTPNLAMLSVEQCRNIAYEIVWSQQPPPPSPPDPIEELYSNPPNTGSMLKSGGRALPTPTNSRLIGNNSRHNSTLTICSPTQRRIA